MMGTPEDYRAIAQRIKQRRAELNLSLQNLADMTDMSKSTLQRYEAGSIRNIPLQKLGILAQALQVSADWLLGWENALGERDLGLMVIDIAKLLNASTEMVESVIEDMGWPSAITPEILSKISAEVERQKTLDQLADEINKQKHYLQTVADSTYNFFSELRALVGIDKQTPHDIFFRDEREIAQMKDEIEDLIGKFMETATPEEKNDFLLRLDQIGEEFHRRMDSTKDKNE